MREIELTGQQLTKLGKAISEVPPGMGATLYLGDDPRSQANGLEFIELRYERVIPVFGTRGEGNG